MIQLETIKRFVGERVPISSYTTSEEESRGGRGLFFKPTNPNAAEMSFWTDGSCGDALLGRAFGIELENCDDAHVFSAVEGVLAGEIRESIWARKGVQHYSKSEIWTGERRLVVRYGIPFMYLPWWKRRYTYEAYFSGD